VKVMGSNPGYLLKYFILYKTKGHLISKCLFGVFNSPKKQTKQFDLRYHSK
jgi:hypothetical protein